MTIELSAPSRLHFGLLSLLGDHASLWPNLEGQPTLPARRFGGVGLMVRDPGLRLAVSLAEQWSCEGPLAARAAAFAATFLSHSPEIEPHRSFRIVVHQAAPEHIGLGAGTQLAMAVADGIAQCCGLRLSVSELGRRVGRGGRSAIGVHGYRNGGFLVDGGKGARTAIAPCLLQVPFPPGWNVLLALPEGLQGEHGSAEIEAFTQLAQTDDLLRQTDAMARVLLLGILPALVERDLQTFGEALYDYNRRAGEIFRPVQGGIYSHGRTAAIVESFRSHGIRAAGQTSWGPTVFAIDEADKLDAAAAHLARDMQVIRTQAFTGTTQTE
jgi:beta-ribofuranosylaminobenzene 5'-phosphate synthase